MTTSASGSAGRAPRLVIAVGEAGRRVATDRCGPGDRDRALADGDDAGPVLDVELPRLGTGWRVLAVGSGRDTATVRAAALARGALDEEVTVVALDPAPRVHCGVCHQRSDPAAGVGDVVRCAGCGSTLVVTDHDSPAHGAVLGAPRVPGTGTP